MTYTTEQNIERCVNYFMDPKYGNNFDQSSAGKQLIAKCCYLTIKNDASNVEDCVNFYYCGEKLD